MTLLERESNLLIDVKNVIDDLPEGKLEYVAQTGKLAVFVFKFATMTPCSSASQSDFSRVIFLKEGDPENKKLVLPELRIKRNVAWSFFTLEDTYDHFTDDGRTVKPEFELPVVPYEEQRIKKLLDNIKCEYNLNQPNPVAKAEKVEPTTQMDGYCQFSGGGDICVHGANVTLVVNGLISEEEDEELSPNKLSPVYEGTSTSTTLSIEGKRGDFGHDKLRNQLFANMVVASVTKFIKGLEQFNEEDIRKVNQVTGCGISYTGSGDVGFYKLKMKFGEETKICTKVPIARRIRVYAAALVDHLLDYYFKRLKQY